MSSRCLTLELGKGMRRTRRLQVIVSEEEAKAIRQKMEKAGFDSLSDFCRNSLLKPSRLNYVKHQAMLYEVNKIGVNLNQVVRAMHRRQIGDLGLLAEIATIREAMQKILKEHCRP